MALSPLFRGTLEAFDLVCHFSLAALARLGVAWGAVLPATILVCPLWNVGYLVI